MSKRILILVCLTLSLLLGGCLGMPEGVEPVKSFDREAYLGSWYEIARLDHSFERGLSRVTAEYSLRDDGGIRVINRGYDAEKGEWKSAEGRAYFTGDAGVGHLKVSFFGPFYSSYVVFELDHENYQYAFVSGFSRDYLWLLSRTPTVEPRVIEYFLKTAGGLGFDTASLIYVSQEQ